MTDPGNIDKNGPIWHGMGVPTYNANAIRRSDIKNEIGMPFCIFMTPGAWTCQSDVLQSREIDNEKSASLQSYAIVTPNVLTVTE